MLPYGHWANHLKSYDACKGDPRVLFLRYADMKTDLKGCVQQIVKHCDIQVRAFPPSLHGYEVGPSITLTHVLHCRMGIGLFSSSACCSIVQALRTNWESIWVLFWLKRSGDFGFDTHLCFALMRYHISLWDILTRLSFDFELYRKVLKARLVFFSFGWYVAHIVQEVWGFRFALTTLQTIYTCVLPCWNVDDEFWFYRSARSRSTVCCPASALIIWKRIYPIISL